MKKLRWCFLALNLAVVGCVAEWSQFVQPEKSKTPSVRPNTPQRPVTEKMVTEQNAHNVAQRQWDELDQEEFQLQRVTVTQPKAK